MRCAIVIPVYNHEATVAGVVRESIALGYPVFVIDDGSTDGTYERIRDISSITVLRHSVTCQFEHTLLLPEHLVDRPDSTVCDTFVEMPPCLYHRQS